MHPQYRWDRAWISLVSRSTRTAISPSTTGSRRARPTSGRLASARVAKLPIVAVLRMRTTAETRAFMKALVATDGDRILGFTMLGAEAGEVMAVVQTAMPFTGLRDAIIAHPTMAEGLGGLLSNWPGG
jgi:pyruvate/2-oxoglutarate dehydrogenase complex dihydrolipoamide dehydrogenase (E3) component